MATDKQTLKNWFKSGAKPLGTMFAAWLDSFFHKDEKIPIANIEGISNYQETSDKGVSNGYASLDGNGKVPTEQMQLPDFSGLQSVDEKGEPDGYASLDYTGKIPAEQLPENMGEGVNIGNSDIEQTDENRLWNIASNNLYLNNFQKLLIEGADYRLNIANSVDIVASNVHLYFDNLTGACSDPSKRMTVLMINGVGQLVLLDLSNLKAALDAATIKTDEDN